MPDPLIGRQLGDYRIDDILGRGGMANVYRGFDPKLQRAAAVKVIDIALLKPAHEADYRRRFKHEARAIARLSHPNIVGVYQFGEVGTLYYMAMVFVEGRDLGQILTETQSPLPPDQVVTILRNIAGALDYAHVAGVIHRDIKPSNIMVTLDNRAVLTDFGLALTAPEGTLGNTFGSAHYIAPEQAISSANAVPQSDLYSLGVVLYQMLTGKVPFDDPSAMSLALKHLSEPPPRPRDINANLSAPVERVILKALEKEPSKRYQTGAKMVEALEEALAASPRRLPTLHRKPAEDSASTPSLQFFDAQVAASRQRIQQARRLIDREPRRRKLLIGGLLAAVLLVSAFTVLMLSNTGTSDFGTSSAVAAAFDTTDLPTLAPTLAPPTAAAKPTLAPTALPLERPPVDPDAPVRLIYDTDKLVLINRSRQPVSLRGWTFSQNAPTGKINFSSVQWESPNLNAVQPQVCLMIWRVTLDDVATPDYCHGREAWFATGQPSLFWLSPRQDATFEVYGDDGTLLATCAVNAGECGVNTE